MDDPSSFYIYIILGLLIILSMLFSISESSILGMNKLRLRVLKQKKEKRALRIAKLLEKRDQLINTLLVSNDIVNVLTSSIIASLSLSIFGEKGVGIATLIATVILLIFGEITPKTISTRCPDKIAYSLSLFVKIVVFIMQPVVKVVTAIANFFLLILGIKRKEKKQTYTEEEIKSFIDLSSEEGLIEKHENHMMSQVFKFSDLEAQDIMIPRTKIKSLPLHAKFNDIIELSQRTGLTRFPVYRKSIDDIVGIVYLKDLLAYKASPDNFSLNKVMRPPLFILGTKKMSSVQTMLFENRQSMAIVVDEYSGTDGLITEKDIAKQIFALPGEGSIRGKVFDIKSVENKEDFEINGLVLLDNVQDALKINLKSNINETIGGWFTEKINRIAKNGDSYTFEGYEFIVTKVQSHRVERIRIRKLKEEEDLNDN